MKSLTGKFTSVGGWAPLLALLLGAGLMISACGDEEVPTPTTPAPTPAPTPTPTPTPTPPPDPEPTGPATPSNLRVSAATSSSITWTWDAVEGVLGYQGQFSTDTTFTDSDRTFIIVAPQTSHTIQNLPGNMTGHFRVRSGTGTSLTDLTFSEWSEGTPGTTRAPPAAVALAAPGDLRTSDPENDSIVLDWDEVDDADSYEVEQREDGTSSWSDATCGDGDNEVEDTTCVASGLAEGTDYDFRVRGIPASDDTASATGAWAETDGTTTGRAAVATSGGMGDLSVTWKSTNTTLIWSWEPMSGAMYQWDVLDGPYDDDAEAQCKAVEDDDYSEASASFSHTEPVTQGDVNLLCVRTDDKDNRALSFAWATTTPEGATVAQDNGGATVNEKHVTTSLTWQDLAVKAGFEYEVRVAVDPQRDNDIHGAGNGMEATPAKAVQAACSAGTFVDQGDTDINFELDEISVSRSLTAYAGYLLCWNMANTAGATAWAVPDQNGEIYTNPAQPPSPRIDSSRTTTTANEESVVWRLAVRSDDDVPRDDSGFVAKLVQYTENWQDGTTSPATKRTTTTPRAAVCEEGDGTIDATSGTWAKAAAGTISTDNQGITVASGTVDRPIADGSVGDTRIHLCVRSNDDGRMGPWAFSGSHEVKRQAESN